MRISRTQALILVFSALAGGVTCRRSPITVPPHDAGVKTTRAPTADATPSPPRQILQTLAAPPIAYELSLENCTRQRRENDKDPSACVFAVRLLEGGRALDRFALMQQGCGPASSTTVDRTLGADREAKAFSTSDERCEIDVAVRIVELAPNVVALLVTELQGFEYRYRRHALLIARGGKLQTLWSYDDDELGMHWSTISVIPGAHPSGLVTGVRDIAFINTERTVDGVAAQVQATRLHLDPASGTIGQQALPDASAPLFVLAVGGFKSAEQTRAARQHCVHDLEMMRAGLFPKVRLPAFFFGAAFARRSDAEDRLAQLATCPKAMKGTILESGFSGGKSHGGDH